MAIAEMKKITLISFHEHKDQLLQSIQALQNFEVVDLPSSDLGDYEGTPRAIESLDLTIKEYQTQIEQIQASLAFLQSHLPKKRLLKKLREEKKAFSLDDLREEMTKFPVETLVTNLLDKEATLESINERRKQLDEDEAFLVNWKKLNFNQTDIKNMAYITGFIGTIPQHVQNQYIDQLKQDELIYIEEIYQNQDEHGIIAFYDNEHKDEVKQILNQCHFSDLTESFTKKPLELLKLIDDEQKTIKQEEKTIIAELKQMNTEEWQLMLAEEYYGARLERERSKRFLVDEKHLFIMEGWLEASCVPSFKTALENTLTRQNYSLLVEDIKEKDYDRVPIVLNNKDVIAPFEGITQMYNLPKYNELDPTPYVAPFYFVFFGMMVADFGYGLLLWLATFIGFKFLNFNPGMKKNLKFFNILSYSTMIWGLIYGSLFGFELPFVLLSTTEDVITIMILSVVFGLIHIFVALGLNTYLKIKQGAIHDSITDGSGWIAILFGIIVVALGSIVLDNHLFVQLGGALAILGVVSIIVASMLGSKNKGLGLGLGIYNLYGITSYIGDIVSYSRLMALGVSGASIALAFNMIIGFFPPLGRFTIGLVLFIALHAVNIGLSMLSAYVHGARLIFVEFFGKFYEGGGKVFEPLKASEKYIQLKNQNK